MRVTAGEQYVRVLGRTLMRDDVRYLGYSCSAIEFTFTGSKAEAVIWSTSPTLEKVYHAWVAVFVNDEEEPSKRFPVEKEEDTYVLYEGTASKETKIRLVKYNEASFGKIGIKAIITDGTLPTRPTAAKTRKIEFIGDSITCGYGIEGKWMVDIFDTAQQNPWNAYAARTARALDADYHMVCWSGIGIISNYTGDDVPNDNWLMPPLYPYTDKAMDIALGNDPEVWDNSRFILDCIIINLGTNDHSYTRLIPERVEVFGREYYNFVKMVRSKNPSSIILCSIGIMGQDLCPEVEKQVGRMISEGDSKLHYLKFDMQDEKDGLGTDWHPVEFTHIKAAKKLEQKVKEIMNW